MRILFYAIVEYFIAYIGNSKDSGVICFGIAENNI
jgi:hypothetical protein